MDNKYVSKISRLEMFGLQFVDAESVDVVVDEILDPKHVTPSDMLPLMVTPNTDIIVRYDKDPKALVTRGAKKAEYILPDGMPLVVASKYLTPRKFKSRLTGSDFFASMWPRLIEEEKNVLIIASSDEVGLKLSTANENVEYYIPPMMDIENDEEIDLVVKEIRAMVEKHDSEFVLFGISEPKNSHLAIRVLNEDSSHIISGARQDSPMCLCVGAAMLMYLGLEDRAPKWMQDSGLEWVHRIKQDPKRMMKRYLIDDSAFFGIFMKHFKDKKQK